MRRKEREEQKRKAELLRLEKEREFAKQQVKLQNENLEVANGDNSSVFDLNLSDIDELPTEVKDNIEDIEINHI